MSSPRALKRAEDSSKNLNKAFTPTMRTRSSDEGRPSEIAEEDEHPPPSDHPPSGPAEKEARAGDGAAPLSPQSSTNSVRGRQISAKSSRSLRASMRNLFSSFRDNARFGTYEHVRGAKGGAFEGKCYVSRDQDCCRCFAPRDIQSLKIVLVKGTYCFVFPTLKDGTAKRDALCLEAIPLKGLETRVDEFAPRQLVLHSPDAGVKSVDMYAIYTFTFHGDDYLRGMAEFEIAVDEASAVGEFEAKYGKTHLEKTESERVADELGHEFARDRELRTPALGPSLGGGDARHRPGRPGHHSLASNVVDRAVGPQ